MDTTHLSKANYHHLVMDIAWFGIALAATTRFLQFYAIRMGATPMELGWLTAMPALVLVIATTFSQWWRTRNADSVKAIWWPSIGFRFIFLLPAFAPFLPEEWRVWWIIFAVTLPALPQAVASALFLITMRETVTPEQLPSLFSRRALAMNITITIGALGFGLLLEALPFPLNYQIMFVMAFVFAMVSQWHIGRLHVIVPVKPKTNAVRRTVRDLLSDTYFQSVAFVTLVSHIAFFSIFAVIPLHLERNLGATEGFMAAFGIAELLAGASVTLLLARFINRIGNRAVIKWALLGTALAAFVIAVSPVLWLTLIGAALTGASWTAIGVGTLGFFSERTAADDVQASTVFHQMIFSAMFIGPLLGSSLVNFGFAIVPVLIMGMVLRMVASILTHYGLALFTGRRVAPLQS